MICPEVTAPDLRVWMLYAREGRLWRRALVCCAALVLLAGPGAAQQMPSGQTVELLDSLLEQEAGVDGLTLVLRYIAPRIARQGGDLRYDDVVLDLDVLCNSDGIDAMALTDQPVGQIVIVLMDRPVERGIPTPEATQLIGAYLPSEEGCIWE